jgi:hypothetical protein
MPRGGPDASWVDRRLQTDRLEYLDRDDVDDRVKRQVVRSLERLGSLFKDHEKFARLALDEVADVADPTILELGSGHGGLSRKLRAFSPSAMRVLARYADPKIQLRIRTQQPWGRQIVVANRPCWRAR